MVVPAAPRDRGDHHVLPAVAHALRADQQLLSARLHEDGRVGGRYRRESVRRLLTQYTVRAQPPKLPRTVGRLRVRNYPKPVRAGLVLDLQVVASLVTFVAG